METRLANPYSNVSYSSPTIAFENQQSQPRRIPSFNQFCFEAGVPSDSEGFWEKRRIMLEQAQTPRLPFFLQQQIFSSHDDATDNDDVVMQPASYVLASISERPIPRTLPPRNSPKALTTAPKMTFTPATSSWYTLTAIIGHLSKNTQILASQTQLAIFSSKKTSTMLEIRPLDNLIENENTVLRSVAHLAGNDMYTAVVFEGEDHIKVYKGFQKFQDCLKQENETRIPFIDSYKQENISSMCLFQHELLVSFNYGPILIHNLLNGSRTQMGKFEKVMLFSTDGSKTSKPYFVGVNPTRAMLYIWSKSSPDQDYQCISHSVHTSKSIYAVGFDEQTFYFGDPRGCVYGLAKERFFRIPESFENPIVDLVVFPEGVLVASKKKIHYFKKHENQLQYTFEISLDLETKRTITFLKKIKDKVVAVGISSGSVQIYQLHL